MTATRQTKTKARLYQAFIALLEERGFNQITVKELCNRAQINRGTFYNNYTDIYDLETWLEDQFFSQINQIPRVDPAHHALSSDSIRAVIDYVKQNQQLVMAMVHGGLANRIETILKQELISIMEDFLQADFERATLLPARYGRTVFASEVSAVIMLWINDGMVESSADLVGMLTVLRDHPLKDIVGPAHD